MFNENSLLTEAQVSACLQISPKKLQKDRQYKTGIPFVRLGRAIRYRTKDIDIFLQKNTYLVN
jgi:hypothetical protein